MIWNRWKKFVTLKKLSLFWHMRIWKRGINLEYYGWAPHKILRCTSTLHREHDIVWKVSIRWLENCGRCSWHNISLTDWPSAKSSFICGRIRICYTMKHHQQYYILSSYIILYHPISYYIICQINACIISEGFLWSVINTLNIQYTHN